MVDISGTVTRMSDREDVAQAIWQTYVANTGQSLPPGLADELAVSAIAAMGESTEVVRRYGDNKVVAVHETKRGTRLPEDWWPSRDVQAELAQKYPNLNLGMILEEFRDYWCAVPGSRGLKLSWDRTFRNRVREVAHKPQYRRQGIGMQGGGQMSKVDAKAMGYLEG